MAAPGPRNLITDVDGILVGNAHDTEARSGVTVVIPEAAATAAVDVRGGAPGTHETDVLAPTCLVDRVDAVCLAGGSAFGLEAAAGVMAWLAERGRGFAVGPAVVPIVPAAILFDLLNGGNKSWGAEPPYRRLGAEAAKAASADFALGNAGAGMGARAGTLKGGLGSASLITADGIQIGALVAANPVGSVTMPKSPTLWAWALEQQAEMGGQPVPKPTRPLDLDHDFQAALGAGTTIAVVATNVTLDKARAARIAIMAHDGFARAVRPVHSPYDGDTVFVLSTGRRPLPDPMPVSLGRIGSLAADCAARALARGVFEAEPLGNLPSYRQLFGDHLKGSS